MDLGMLFNSSKANSTNSKLSQQIDPNTIGALKIFLPENALESFQKSNMLSKTNTNVAISLMDKPVAELPESNKEKVGVSQINLENKSTVYSSRHLHTY